MEPSAFWLWPPPRSELFLLERWTLVVEVQSNYGAIIASAQRGDGARSWLCAGRDGSKMCLDGLGDDCAQPRLPPPRESRPWFRTRLRRQAPQRRRVREDHPRKSDEKSFFAHPFRWRHARRKARQAAYAVFLFDPCPHSRSAFSEDFNLKERRASNKTAPGRRARGALIDPCARPRRSHDPRPPPRA